MKYPEISRRFKHILSLRDMKQIELADRAGIDKSFISHYVNGTHCPSNEKAQLLADILNVNPLWLMDLSDDMLSPATQFTPDQVKLLELFGALNDFHKKSALEHLMWLNSQENQTSDDLSEN